MAWPNEGNKDSSKSDKKLYRHITLSNRLKCVLICDTVAMRQRKSLSGDHRSRENDDNDESEDYGSEDDDGDSEEEEGDDDDIDDDDEKEDSDGPWIFTNT